MIHGSWVVEHGGQLRMVILGRTLESRVDDLVTRFVVVPPGALEVEHGGRPFTEHSRQVGRWNGRITSTPTYSFRRVWSRVVPDTPSPVIPPRPFIIGVAGGSSSGKTTISERLVALTGPEHVSLIELDSYYLDRSDEPPEQRRVLNYDHPDAFDWPLLNDHLAALANGASVPVPIYDYALDNRSGRVRLVEPARIIVVDGILVLWDRALRERFDLKIFVDTAADVRLIRRLRRDLDERGRSAESVIDQYLATVKPAHERFIEPSKRYADVIIPEGGLNRPAIEVLLARVRELTLG